MKKLIKYFTSVLTMFLLIVSSVSFAQTELIDVLYLKNGSIIKGTITELVPNQTVKIRTADGSLFVFKMEEVDKVVKEERNTNKPATQIENRSEPKIAPFTPFPHSSAQLSPVYESATIILSANKRVGIFYVDEKYYKDVGKYNSLKIKGLPEGDHRILFKSERDSINASIKTTKLRVYICKILNDSIKIITEKYKAPQQERRIKIVKQFTPKQKYYGLIRIGVGFPITGLPAVGETNGLTITNVSGYQFSPFFAMGIGLGYYQVWNDILTYHFAPLFLNTKLTFLKSRVTPTFSLDIGAQLPLAHYFHNEKDADIYTLGGIYFASGVGVKVFLSSSLNLNFDVSVCSPTENDAHLLITYGLGF